MSVERTTQQDRAHPTRAVLGNLRAVDNSGADTLMVGTGNNILEAGTGAGQDLVVGAPTPVARRFFTTINQEATR
jgi:hypothetical protein